MCVFGGRRFFKRMRFLALLGIDSTLSSGNLFDFLG